MSSPSWMARKSLDAPTNQKKSQLHFFSWKFMLLHWKWCIFFKNLNRHYIHTGIYSHKSKDWRSATSNSKEVPIHCEILEHWNSQKSLTSVRQHFSCWLDDGIAKICKKKNSWWLFEIIHIIHFEMHMDRPDKSENIFGIYY